MPDAEPVIGQFTDEFQDDSRDSAKPPEAESFEAFAHLKEIQKIAVDMPIPSKYGTGS